MSGDRRLTAASNFCILPSLLANGPVPHRLRRGSGPIPSAILSMHQSFHQGVLLSRMRRAALSMLLIATMACHAHAEWDAGLTARQRGDFAAAYREIRMEAEAGAADAQEALGQMLIHGQGTAKDESGGTDWLHRAAENGSVPGMVAFGTAALRGLGMPRNETLGIQWLTRAANGANQTAMLSLGDCYEQGTGVPRNILAALPKT